MQALSLPLFLHANWYIIQFGMDCGLNPTNTLNGQHNLSSIQTHFISLIEDNVVISDTQIPESSQLDTPWRHHVTLLKLLELEVLLKNLDSLIRAMVKLACRLNMQSFQIHTHHHSLKVTSPLYDQIEILEGFGFYRLPLRHLFKSHLALFVKA